MASSINHFRLSDHARLEMSRRQISVDQIRRALAAPETVTEAGAGLQFFQGRIEQGDPPKPYILRVLVRVNETLPVVVTVYRSSKIKKYVR
jgi:hypothetical protein